MASRFIGVPMHAAVKERRALIERGLKAVVLETLKAAVRLTPVDTGRARGDWRVADLASHSAAETADKNGSATIARGLSDIAAIKLGDGVAISLAVPYAQRLDEGWSKQAPGGMTAGAIQAGTNAANRLRRL